MAATTSVTQTGAKRLSGQASGNTGPAIFSRVAKRLKKLSPLPKMTVARSWRPLLEGKSVPWRDYVVCETSIGGLSICIRDKRFKTIFYPDRTRLFDIQNDPLETKDLAGDAAHATVARRHREHLQDYLSRIEVYPGPPQLTQAAPRPRRAAARRPRLADLYTPYVQWYKKLQAEG